jgi:hypothetical protein
MIVNNKNLVRYQTSKDSDWIHRFNWLSIYIGVILVVSFVCNVTFGKFDYDELDPTALLAVDSETDEQAISDIQIPSHAELLASSHSLSQASSYNMSQALPGNSITSHPVEYPLQSADALTLYFAAEVKDNPRQNITSPAETSSKKLERQLMESRISTLPQEYNQSKSDELKQAIGQIKSVKFGPRLSSQQTVTAAPAETVASATGTEQTPKSVQTSPSGSLASDETLKLLENQIKDPNLIRNPFELAEILFKSGKQSQAGICYKQALKALPADDPNVASERAWILFQIGNCLKDEDPNTARESYAELIRTHSNSPWTEIAKTRYGIIEWYQQDNPRDILNERRGNSSSSLTDPTKIKGVQ